MIYLQECTPQARRQEQPQKRKRCFPWGELGKSVAISLVIVILLQGIATINQYERMKEWGNAWGAAWVQTARLK